MGRFARFPLSPAEIRYRSQDNGKATLYDPWQESCMASTVSGGRPPNKGKDKSMQVKQLKSSVTAITGRVRGAKLLLGVLLISQAGLAAKHERNHPFVAGDVDESRIARQVRHE